MPEESLSTSKADLVVGRPYDTLWVKYGVCCHHDNRPAYLRIQIECRTDGQTIHKIAHVIQQNANQRGSVMVAQDMGRFYHLFQKLDFLPEKSVEIEIADLCAFLMMTRQRVILGSAEYKCLSRFRVLTQKSDLKTVIRLAEREFSDELVEYAEGIVEHNASLTPTLERLGFTKRKHYKEVKMARIRVGLWK